MKHWYYQWRQNAHGRQALRRLRALEKRLASPLTRLGVPFLFRGPGYFRSMRPMQSQAELGELYQRILARRPRTVVEIGTCHGGTLYLWCQAADPQAVIVSIDLPGGQFGGGYRSCRADFYRAFAQPGQQLHLVRADSHAPETVAEVRRLLGSRDVDFLFIDGDHTYAGVKQDFTAYSTLVMDQGIIALHDIAPRPAEPAIEVWKLWQEIKAQYDGTLEWLDQTQNGRPIGIGWVPWCR